MNHDKITYNPLQKETVKYVDEDCNLVVLAPTSSGKTIVAEQFIFPALALNKRVIYLSPLKALTNEKLNEWQITCPSVQAITGDHHNTTTAIQSHLILMTTEALDSKTRGAKSWLQKTAVLVSDESHLLSSPGRGDAFEVGLTRFASINPEARIIFLSATIPNTEILAEWLTTLNGKPTKIVKTEWRPVEQEYFLIKTESRHWDFLNDVKNNLSMLRKKHKDQQMLIFVHTVNIGHMISKYLKCPFHYSKVSMEDRHNIEQGFKKKSIRTLVATSTLAYGLNLPADVGVIVGAHRGPMMVDPADLKQEAGRIGRYGLSEKGYVYFLFPETYAEEVYFQVANTPDIVSVLPERLYFHITSFIAREDMQEKEISAFLEKTLAFKQHKLYIQEALDVLLQYEIIRKEDKYVPTNLGRASALMYIDPIDLWHWKNNFGEKPMTPTAIAIAFAYTPSQAVHTAIPQDLKNVLDMGYGQATITATCLRDWISGGAMEGIKSVIIPPIIKDIDRVISALKIAGLDKSYLDSLAFMIKYGVHDQVIDLVKLPGIGRKRAISLYDKKIRNIQDIKNNPKVSKNILGSKVFHNVTKERIPGKIYLEF